MASTIRVNTIEPYTGTSVTITGDIAVTGNVTITDALGVERITGESNTLELGTDASGSNAAATNFTQVAPLSTGNATPAALVWQVGVQGASGSTPQTATEGWRVQDIANEAGSRELTAWNASGPVMGAVPTSTPSTWFVANHGVRAFAGSAVFGAGATNPQFSAFYAAGSLASPTQVLANTTTFNLTGWARTDTSTWATIGQLLLISRDNITASARGSRWRVTAADVGGSAAKALVDFRGGGTNVAEIQSQQATLRIIVGATQFAFRDSGGTADTWTINAAGTSISAPLLTSYTTGVQASGTNTAASDLTITGPISTGNATPAALIWRVGVQGASGSTAQTATEAFRVQEVANSSSREVAAWNVTGPVMGNIPANTAASVLQSGDGGRFQTAIRVVRVGNAASFTVARVNTSLSGPSQVLAGESVGQMFANAYGNAGAFVSLGGFQIISRDNITATTAGSTLSVLLNDAGSASTKTVVQVRGGGSNIAELVSGQSTLRLIPGATQFAIRDSGNTADAFTVNAAGTAIYAPIVTAFGVGTSSNNAAAILQADSTTRGFLPPRMTTAQRDAISSPPAGLMIYNTTTNKLNVYTTAWEAITSA